jgi:hypothetical protein
VTVVGDVVALLVTVRVRVVVAVSVLVVGVVVAEVVADAASACLPEVFVVEVFAVDVFVVEVFVVDAFAVDVFVVDVFVVDGEDLSVALAIAGAVPVALRVLVKLALTLPERLCTAPEPHAESTSAHPTAIAQSGARSARPRRLNPRPARRRGTSTLP